MIAEKTKDVADAAVKSFGQVKDKFGIDKNNKEKVAV